MTELIAAERRLLRAIAARDQARLATIVGNDFVLRVPGEPDIDKAAFLAAIAAIPGDIISVEGSDMTVATLSPDRAMVSGTQISRVHLEDSMVEDKQAFVDLFALRNGDWILIWAMSVPLHPAPP
jgi:hypothetical protein